MAVPSKPSAALSIYRKLLCGVALLCLLSVLCLLGLAAGAAAQAAPPKKKQRSARAVALLEWHKDSKGALGPRLVPISFLWEGKYYDAGLYEASPRPLALEPGTVYEATRSGVPAGLYTVRGGVSVKGVWYGDGMWSPGVTGSPKSASGDDERPRLSRAAADSTSAPPPAQSSSGDAKSEPEPNDPNRPTLHRGAGRATAAPTAPAPPAAAPKPVAAPAAPKPADEPEPLVAVSDEQTQETRPYLFQWNRDEEERLTGEVKVLAEAEVAREAGAKLELEQVRARAFDLYSSNLPEIVLTARTSGEKSAAKGLKGQPRIYYVTVVARVTVSGEVRKLFASVTSSSWLGSVPRMELVDAVDADGDGNGDLLFALVTESSRSYAIYRVGRDELFKLVETGPFPND